MKKRFVLLLVCAVVLSCSSGDNNEKLLKEFDSVSQQVKKEFAPDRRLKTYEPKLIIDKEIASLPILKGSTTEPEAKEALIAALKKNNIDVLDSMVLLPHPSLGDKTFGITAQSVINFRYGAS